MTDSPHLPALRKLAEQDDMLLDVDRAPAGERARLCMGACGLAAEPGDIFCTGCREGHDRDRPQQYDATLNSAAYDYEPAYPVYDE